MRKSQLKTVNNTFNKMSSQPRRIKNPLEEHAYINEAIKRENRYARTNEVFTLNPRSLIMLSDKPNNNTLLRD